MKRSLKQLNERLLGIDWLMAAGVIAVGSLASILLPSNAQGYAVGGTVALLIAFVAYPWQKHLDRRASFEIEQRSALREFLGNWYDIEADTRNLRVFDPKGKEPTAFGRLLLAIRTRRKKTSFEYLLICAEEDVAQIIEMDQNHDVILDTFNAHLEKWLSDQSDAKLSINEFMIIVNEAITAWEPRHKVLLAKLTNSCRERTPFVEHKTQIGFSDRGTTK